MIRHGLKPELSSLLGKSPVVLAILLTVHLCFNILANSSFKVSAGSQTWRGFLTWQIVGNLSGFLAVLTLTGFMRHVPLHLAYPLSAGLTIIGVQVVASRLIFQETISPIRWLGTLLVVVGVVLITRH